MKNRSDRGKDSGSVPLVLVAIDFSYCSELAMRKAKDWVAREHGKILALHVIDEHFVSRCIRQELGSEAEIKERLYLNAKSKLQDLLRREGIEGANTEIIVCEGTPCLEINKKAVEHDAEMIIIGSKGNSDDMNTIFFGSTTERVLRFIKRPVLCVPPDSQYNLK